MQLSYIESQSYIDYFKDQQCAPYVVNQTQAIFDLAFSSATELDALKSELEKKDITIARLREITFGKGYTDHETEEQNTSSDNDSDEVDPSKGENSDKSKTSNNQDNRTSNNPDAKKKKGHGRLGLEAYTGAETVQCQCDLSVGDTCPQCQHGKLTHIDLQVKLHIDGSAPFIGTRYELERLACTFCDFTVTATAPVDISHKYSNRAKATLVYMHYAMGLPYYRLAIMQKMVGVPVPCSTQSDLVASAAGPGYAVFNALITYAAQAPCIALDDTHVKISSLIEENKTGNPERRGMYTSGFIASGEECHTVVLFFSGRAHAGENFGEIIEHRKDDQPKVIKLSDALAANSVCDVETIDAKCNAHAHRRFRNLLSAYPEEAHFVMAIYGQVYDHDAHCKEQALNEQQRLEYHQTYSAPLMGFLGQWVNQQLADGSGVEPNGALARECRYLFNHWESLTQFLRVPGIPLDNNAMEGMLKVMIMYRKNSQFFRNTYSAHYGSIFTSLIATCRANNINAIDYIEALLNFEALVWENPKAWLPWNYQRTLIVLKHQQSGSPDSLAPDKTIKAAATHPT